MKSIKQIFHDEEDLLNNPSVQELIQYTKELEDEVVELRQDNDVSKEDHLAGLVRDIYHSIQATQVAEEEHQRFGFDKPNYEEGINNLKKVILEFAKDYKFRL